MTATSIWPRPFALHAITVLASVGVFSNAFSGFARGDTNPLCAVPEVYDLDGSGLVAPADLLALIDGMNGPDPQSPRFDIDGSGEVNQLDIDALAAGIEACRQQQSASTPDGRSETQIVAGEPQVVVTLTPSSLGPYATGQQITIAVSLQRAQAGIQLRARLIQFDLVLSNPALGITYPITHPFALLSYPPGPIHFWDFSSTPSCMADPVGCGDTYFIDDFGPVLNITYVGLSQSASRQVTVPGDAMSVPVGLLQVDLPSTAGVYRLDMMNASNQDVNFGAEFRGGFGTANDPSYHYRASTGQFAGGMIDLAVGTQECVSGNPCLDDGLDCTEDICVDEVCQHPPRSAGTPCGNSTPQGVCDQPDQCDGTGVCSLNFVSADVVCRAARNECDQAENCTLQSAACPPDLFSLSGTPCTDEGMECTYDTCLSGECTHVPYPPGTLCFDDGIECTSDICSNGACVHPPRAAGTPCGQQQSQGACDTADICDGTGACSANLSPGGTPCRAAAGECDESEFCNGQSPGCPADLFISSGTPCSDDGDECTDDACDGAGQCDHAEIQGCRDIPTVSTWGLVILSILLLVGAKLRFQIRATLS